MLIKNGLVLNACKNNAIEEILDVEIDNNLIVAIGKNLPKQGHKTIIDATNQWVCPGFIDIHCHLRDLKQSASEDIESGTLTAASGGYTTLVSMANTNPAIDNIEILKEYINLIKTKSKIEVLPLASLTKNLAGHELVEINNLTKHGAIGFSDDGMPFTNRKLLFNALLLTKNLDTFILSHPEDKSLSEGAAINLGAKSFELGLDGIPNCSESGAIASEIEIVRETESKIHFSHVSLASSINLIKSAKLAGLNITCDITPHHLVLNENDITNYSTSFKMNPPLRSLIDNQALINGIIDGTIDAIGTDHAPHNSSLKNCSLDNAAFGITGLETAMSLVYEKMYLSNLIDKLKLIALFTTNPAQILNIDRGQLKPGQTANLTVFNPDYNWTPKDCKTHSKSANTPFLNRKLRGKITTTIFNGKIVYNLDQVL